MNDVFDRRANHLAGADRVETATEARIEMHDEVGSRDIAVTS